MNRLTSFLKAVAPVSILLAAALFATQCADNYKAPVIEPIAITHDGLFKSTLTQSNNKIYYSAKNTSGRALGEVQVVIQLYSASSPLDASTLLATRWVRQTLNDTTPSPQTFLHEDYPALTKQSIRIIPIKVENISSDDLSGEYEGTYTLFKQDTISYAMRGFLDYQGQYRFEALHGPDLFKSVEGRVYSNKTMDVRFVKIDNSIVSSPGGKFSVESDKILLETVSITSDTKFSAQLRKVPQ